METREEWLLSKSQIVVCYTTLFWKVDNFLKFLPKLQINLSQSLGKI